MDRVQQKVRAARADRIQVIKHTVVGEISRDNDSGEQLLDVFAKMAMADAREDMTFDHPTKAVYEIEDGHAKTVVVIENVPHNQPT